MKKDHKFLGAAAGAAPGTAPGAAGTAPGGGGAAPGMGGACADKRGVNPISKTNPAPQIFHIFMARVLCPSCSDVGASGGSEVMRPALGPGRRA
jgi:hypothetical protein